MEVLMNSIKSQNYKKAEDHIKAVREAEAKNNPNTSGPRHKVLPNFLNR